jgi:hypothetical protein
MDNIVTATFLEGLLHVSHDVLFPTPAALAKDKRVTAMVYIWCVPMKTHDEI